MAQHIVYSRYRYRSSVSSGLQVGILEISKVKSACRDLTLNFKYLSMEISIQNPDSCL